MSTSSSLRQQFGAFCTNVPLGVWTLLEAPGLTTTLTAPKTALCVCVSTPGKRFSSTGSTVGGVLKKRRSRQLVCVHPWTKGFLRPLQSGRGVWHSRPTTRNEAVGESGKQGPINPAYLLQLLNTLSNFWFDSWWFHTILSPQTGFPPQPFRRSCSAASRASETTFNNSNHRTCSPCRSITFLPIGVIELTENQCQSVFA